MSTLQNTQFKKLKFIAKFKSIVRLKLKSILKTGKDLVTINGQFLKSRVDEFTIHINESKLINRDVMATNGVIHSVDSLIRKGYHKKINVLCLDKSYFYCLKFVSIFYN